MNVVFMPMNKGQLIKTSGFLYELEIDISEINSDFAREHRRLRVFHHKGLCCSNPNCSRVGTRFVLAKDRQGNKHWDIYTSDMILMNVDHIIARKQGGSNHLSNLQPMCLVCNSSKGHALVSNDELSSYLVEKEKERKRNKKEKELKRRALRQQEQQLVLNQVRLENQQKACL